MPSKNPYLNGAEANHHRRKLPLYESLSQGKYPFENHKEGMSAAFNAVIILLKENGVSYDEFIFSL